MKDFRKLRIWIKAHQITLAVYKATAKFPREGLYGLTSQIRRCSASIAANIAEGCGRRGNAEFNRFLQIASGSGSELDYHLLLARDLGLLSVLEHRNLEEPLSDPRLMLSSLILTIDTGRELAKC